MAKQNEKDKDKLPKVKANDVITKKLPVTYSESELKTFSGELARLTSFIKEQENAKKASASGFKAKIDQAKADAESLSIKINTGHGEDMIDCEVFLNMPNTGKKTTVRKDTGVTVDVVDMNEEELQIEMDFKTAE